jgi:hypothetical protein
MSLKICAAENLISDSVGTGFSQSWLPTVAAERFLTSSKDGPVDRAPDQVPFIDGEILYSNPYDTSIHAMMSIHRASRFLLASNPNTLVLDDAWSWNIAVSPAAPLPSGTNAGFGIRQQQNRTSQTPLIFCRLFADRPDYVSYADLGEIPSGESLHFRYRCLFSTPGNWRGAIQPRYEANARYTRLRLWTAPWLTGTI